MAQKLVVGYVSAANDDGKYGNSAPDTNHFVCDVNNGAGMVAIDEHSDADSDIAAIIE